MATGTCKHHGQVKVVAGVPGGRIFAHALMTLLTCGLWIFIWMGDTIVSATKRCSVCDGPVT